MQDRQGVLITPAGWSLHAQDRTSELVGAPSFALITLTGPLADWFAVVSVVTDGHEEASELSRVASAAAADGGRRVADHNNTAHARIQVTQRVHRRPPERDSERAPATGKDTDKGKDTGKDNDSKGNVISRQILYMVRYNRPPGLEVSDSGVIQMSNLMEVWGRVRHYSQDAIMRAVLSEAINEKDGSLRFGLYYDSEGEMALQVVRHW